MNPRLMRIYSLTALTLALTASLAVTAGSAIRLRSAGYRAECAEILTRELGLPSEIGRVIPRSRRSMEFRDIVVWLPEKRAKAHTCGAALFEYIPGAANPDDYQLRLHNGSCEISTRTWLRSDYRDLIGRGLRPGFSPDGPRRVIFSDMSLSFERDGFRVRLDEAAGTVSFESQTVGTVGVTCGEINGHHCDDPAVLTARFSPREDGFRVDDLTLVAPELPISVARLKELAGIDAVTGTFRGKLQYRETDQARQLTLSGRCTNLSLPEFTAPLLPAPIRGTCPDIEIDELLVENREPVRLRFHGTATGVSIHDLAALLGLGEINSLADFEIREADLTRSGIARFSAAGTCKDIPLEAVSSAAGLGKVTGRLRVTIQDLTIHDNRIASLKAVIEAPPAEDDEERWIEGRVLRELASRVLKFDLPPILPERIDYRQLGVRLEVVDERLFIYGTHGEGKKTILTVRFLGRDLPLVQEPSKPFELGPWLDDLRTRAAERILSRFPAASREAASREAARE